MVNPCCGIMSLRRGAILITFLTILRPIICLCVTSAFLYVYLCCKKSLTGFLESYSVEIQFLTLSKSVVVGLTCFMIGVFLFELPLYSYVLRKVYQRNQRQVELWWRLKWALLGIACAFGIVAFVLSEDKTIIGAVAIFALIHDFYLLWILKAYSNELKMEEGSFQK